MHESPAQLSEMQLPKKHVKPSQQSSGPPQPSLVPPHRLEQNRVPPPVPLVQYGASLQQLDPLLQKSPEHSATDPQSTSRSTVVI